MKLTACIRKHITIWKRAFRKTFGIDTTLGASGIAFFSLFSLFPLLLLIIAVSSLWFDSQWVKAEIVNQVDFIIPGFSKLLGTNLEKVIKTRGSVTQFASLILIWSGSSLFSVMARTLDLIWNDQEARTGFRYRGLSLLFVLGLSILVLPILFVASTVIPIIRYYEPDFVPRLYSLLSPLVSTLIGCLLFGLLYRLVPRNRPLWRDVLPGAITCGILWELAKRGFQLYTSSYLTTSNLVYGSVATITAFLTWVYLSGLIFFFGAYLSKGYRNYRCAKVRRESSD
ncbi:MAG: YihY/virulence factor BrkB family protein [Anaerolineales bacterium]|nr:YihY/virulence factor BrkB family protein [Anaerolineales bacterium]